jgi:hypothetical protein
MKESETVEFKESMTQLKEAVISIASIGVGIIHNITSSIFSSGNPVFATV